MATVESTVGSIVSGSSGSVFNEINHRQSTSGSGATPGSPGSFFNGAALGAGVGILKTAVGQFAPSQQNLLATALTGDVIGSAKALLSESGLLQRINDSSVAATLLFETIPNPLLGGLTPFAARQIHQTVQSTAYARKNLFFIEILDYFPEDGGTQSASSSLFNLFATSVSLGANTISGETIQIGSRQMDRVNGSERTDIRITAYDDTAGSIKTWFDYRADRVAHADGSFGVPYDYLVQVRIIHGAVSDDSKVMFGGYEEKYVCRPGTIETELSRTDDGLQEVQMTFSQFDSFMFQPTPLP